MRWLTAFLRDRRQRVVCQQTFSNWEPTVAGVPQGALLSPILFLLYINDLPARLKSTVKLFADDTKIYRTISSEEDAAKLQHDLNRLAAWSDTWHMNFNADTCVVVQVKKGSNYVYTLNGKELASVKQQKDLGLLVSSSLMPRNHIETTCSKVNRKTGMTKRCFMNKSQKQMTKNYETVSRPVLEYASTVWSPWLKKDIELLENTQDRESSEVREHTSCV